MALGTRSSRSVTRSRLESPTADVLWRNLVTAALLGAFGVHPEAQIVAIVGSRPRFALEPALFALVPDVGRFGPPPGAPSGISGISPNRVVARRLGPGDVRLGRARLRHQR
jgi:hypothetical protein